jgi:hypothetical protein
MQFEGAGLGPAACDEHTEAEPIRVGLSDPREGENLE